MDVATATAAGPSRTSGSMARDPVHPRPMIQATDPEDQGDRPEPPGPPKPLSAGQHQGDQGGDNESPGQRRGTDGTDGEAQQRPPRRRPRGRGGHAEHDDGPPTRPEHTDHPREADDGGHQGRAEGQPGGPPGWPPLAEHARREKEGHGRQKHDDGRRGDERDQHGLEHARGRRPPGRRSPRPTAGRVGPRIPSGAVRGRAGGPEQPAPAPTGRRRRRPGPPTGRGPARCTGRAMAR